MDMRRQILGDYAYYLKVERQLSPNTVASYCSDVRKLLESTETTPRDIGTGELSAWLAGVSGELSSRSQARMLSAFKSFFDWMVDEGDREDNPCDGIDAPKLGRHLPEVLSVKEVGDIIASVRCDGWTGLRDRAILEILYGRGWCPSGRWPPPHSPTTWKPVRRQPPRHSTTQPFSTASGSL